MNRICPPEIISPEQRAWASVERAKAISDDLKRAGRSRCAAGLVYFIRAESGPIKIGRARNAEQRLMELQIGSHELLTIMATVEGGLVAERGYHTKFAEHRIRGEWFAPHTDIIAEIERLGFPTLETPPQRPRA